MKKLCIVLMSVVLKGLIYQIVFLKPVFHSNLNCCPIVYKRHLGLIEKGNNIIPTFVSDDLSQPILKSLKEKVLGPFIFVAPVSTMLILELVGQLLKSRDKSSQLLSRICRRIYALLDFKPFAKIA